MCVRVGDVQLFLPYGFFHGRTICVILVTKFDQCLTILHLATRVKKVTDKRLAWGPLDIEEVQRIRVANVFDLPPTNKYRDLTEMSNLYTH